MQRASFELLGGAFFMVKRPVDQTQKGTPYGVGVHVQSGHSGGGGDRKRGGELSRALAFTPNNHIYIFNAGGLSSPPFSGILDRERVACPDSETYSHDVMFNRCVRPEIPHSFMIPPAEHSVEKRSTFPPLKAAMRLAAHGFSSFKDGWFLMDAPLTLICLCLVVFKYI